MRKLLIAFVILLSTVAAVPESNAYIVVGGHGWCYYHPYRCGRVGYYAPYYYRHYYRPYYYRPYYYSPYWRYHYWNY